FIDLVIGKLNCEHEDIEVVKKNVITKDFVDNCYKAGRDAVFYTPPIEFPFVYTKYTRFCPLHDFAQKYMKNVYSRNCSMTKMNLLATAIANQQLRDVYME